MNNKVLVACFSMEIALDPDRRPTVEARVYWQEIPSGENWSKKSVRLDFM